MTIGLYAGCVAGGLAVLLYVANCMARHRPDNLKVSKVVPSASPVPTRSRVAAA